MTEFWGDATLVVLAVLFWRIDRPDKKEAKKNGK